jgi:predicted  nucleic acid-binding Zn-ribbon protein
VKADPEAQRRLLELQAIDTALAQLAHRRKNLPELAELDKLARELSSLEDERVRVQVAVDDIDRDIARLDKDVEQVRTRADRDRTRLDAGTGPARELEALQHELATLSRRQGELEDAELELMERREQEQSTVDAIEARLGVARQARDEVEARRDAAVAEVESETAARISARVPIAVELPKELLDLYEKIRESSGMGAALLRAGRCQGCRLEIAGSELSRIRSADADEVVRCEECRRILVRTTESGL